jgi:hypothetical protein
MFVDPVRSSTRSTGSISDPVRRGSVAGHPFDLLSVVLRLGAVLRLGRGCVFSPTIGVGRIVPGWPMFDHPDDLRRSIG